MAVQKEAFSVMIQSNCLLCNSCQKKKKKKKKARKVLFYILNNFQEDIISMKLEQAVIKIQLDIGQ